MRRARGCLWVVLGVRFGGAAAGAIGVSSHAHPLVVSYCAPGSRQVSALLARDRLSEPEITRCRWTEPSTPNWAAPGRAQGRPDQLLRRGLGRSGSLQRRWFRRRACAERRSVRDWRHFTFGTARSSPAVSNQVIACGCRSIGSHARAESRRAGVGTPRCGPGGGVGFCDSLPPSVRPALGPPPKGH
jgi:hypothetical protein